MVSHPRGTSDTRRIRRLKPPKDLQVEAGASGQPIRVREASLRAWQDVHLVRQPWRIDQHWWRSDEVSRIYFQIAVEDGLSFTVYRDLVRGKWFRQEYA